MNILVVGSGAREHTIVWKLRQSPSVEAIFCTPGNAGTAAIATNVPIAQDKIDEIIAFVQREHIDLTVIGPEQPLVNGIVDQFRLRGLKVFGPTQFAAQLEGSKVFSKEFMSRHGIPTAKHRSFRASEVTLAQEFIKSLKPPIVVKADGLAAGKGVLICPTREEAVDGVTDMMVSKVFGAAGERIVVEEYLTGEEASLFVLTDGERYMTLAPAQDHKRVFDGDLGKNTGGMGAYAPAPVVTDDVMQNAIRDIIEPTLAGMRAEGNPYTGCLYIGLMIGEDGTKVLEYNCRFGDPEAQVVIPLIDGDFAKLLLSIAAGRLDPECVRRSTGSAVCVVMASKGYPDAYETGKVIEGLERIHGRTDVVAFHAGTKEIDASLVTAGGRVLGVTALSGSNLVETIRKAYETVALLHFEGAHFRTDIGEKAFRHLH